MDKKNLVVEQFRCYCTGDDFSRVFKPNARFVTDEALQLLAQETRWNNLRYLDLSGAKNLTDEGVRCLPDRLFKLDLSDTGVTNRGLVGLSPYLSELYLDNTQITGLSKSFANRKYLRTLSLSGTRVQKDKLLPFLPPRLSKLYLTNAPAMPTSFTGAPRGTCGHLMDRTYLQSLETTKGFSWLVYKEGHPPHFVVGLCHWVSNHMNRNPSLLAALARSRIVFTEQGHHSGSFRLGWEASADGFIAGSARSAGLDLRALDTDECERSVRELTHAERESRQKQLALLGSQARLIGVIANLCGSIGITDSLFEDQRPPITIQRVNQDNMWNEIVRTWIDGDDQSAARLEETLNQVHRGRFRTSLWMKQLAPLLDSSKETVGIFPGYLHTVGPGGLVELLNKLGWDLIRLPISLVSV